MLSGALGLAATGNWLMLSNRKTVEGLTVKRRAAALARLESGRGTWVWGIVAALSALVAVLSLAGGMPSWWIWLVAAVSDVVSLLVRRRAAQRVRGYLANTVADTHPIASGPQ